MEASHVYIRRGGAIPLLAPLYTGPYKMLARQAKFFKLEIGGRQETVSVDHLKPHLGLAPVVLAAPPVRGQPPDWDSDCEAPAWNHFSWHACQVFCTPKLINDRVQSGEGALWRPTVNVV